MRKRGREKEGGRQGDGEREIERDRHTDSQTEEGVYLKTAVVIRG